MKCCNVCGCNWSYDVFNPEDHPLSALGLPKSYDEAINRKRYPMDFVSCFGCGHVYNRKFKYKDVPYETNSNLMYNSGNGWLQHIDNVIDWILQYKDVLKTGPIIDIGCGDGQFLKLLLEREPSLHCIGYEPGIEAKSITEFEVIQDYFQPEVDFLYRRPSLILCRHVLEHLTEPREFIESIDFWSMLFKFKPLLFLEVPCIDKALKTARVSDFLYEHVSNFTLRSFNRLAQITNLKIHEVKTLYNDEVLAGLFQCGQNQKPDGVAEIKNVCNNLNLIRDKLKLITSPIYFWGGTGKSASFLNLFNIDAESFPYVVDSDTHKVGNYVPGTGQYINHSTWLATQKPGVIVITTPWRARDIYTEIKTLNLPYENILIFYQNGLHQYDDIQSTL